MATLTRHYSIHTENPILRKRIKLINGDIHADCPKCNWLGGPYTNEDSALISLKAHIKKTHNRY